MISLIEQSRTILNESIDHFKNELRTVRTGRASPSILDHCMVEAYGVKTPLRELASIAIADARTLTIQPWDKSILKDIERAITEARVGGNPVADSTMIRLILPALTEESRKEMSKLVSEKLEDAKQSLRRTRDTVRDQLTALEKENGITEDDRYRGQRDLDTLIQEYQARLLTIAEEKVQEVMTI